MKIYDMKVNHLTNPLGFRMTRTVFSWKVAEAIGKNQTEARIQVAADAQMHATVFDSGFAKEADSLGYRADFELRPYTRYYWTVTVRTDKGEEATGETQWFETAKRDDAWIGRWITCNNEIKRHPVFEKEICPAKPVRQARLYICGLGLYEAYFDGMRIGDEYLTPYSNDYNEWVQYQTFDVTEQVNQCSRFQKTDETDKETDQERKDKDRAYFGKTPACGKLSIWLGNGWYKARFGFTAFEDKGFYGNEWKLIAELRLTYEDGSIETIGTDESWKVRRSNITFSNLYDGEYVDNTLPELPVEQVRFCEAPKGALTERMSLPVTIHEEFEPVELIHTPAGETVFDMGQEFTGIFALRVHEPAGTVIHIQTGEILQRDPGQTEATQSAAFAAGQTEAVRLEACAPTQTDFSEVPCAGHADGNFYNANLRSAKSEYYYVSDGTEKTIVPHFTFFGYRYVKVEGVTNLRKEDFKGLALYSDLEFTGQMETGHALVNRFIKNVQWGLKSNFVDVPTDCPQRDERMGWTGDAQVFSPTATYLSDTYAFYAKYLYDMAKEQSALDGKVPDVVPSCGVESTACVWGDASCIIPWNLYLFYGDKSILEDQFESMKSWVDYIRRVDNAPLSMPGSTETRAASPGNKAALHNWRHVFHYGDWLALDNPAGGAEQVMGGTDEEFIANLYYAVSAGLVSNAAHVLGKEAEEAEYRALSDEQFAVVKNEYYSATGRCCIKTQTALILTLKYHLSENVELTRKQLQKLFELSNGKLRTGFVGTPLLNNVLTENGFEELAYGLLLNEDYPGWLHEVKLGATTVWERWNSLLDDGTISGISMNSMNHYAYGSVLEWMFRHVAGINTVEEAPGLRKVAFMPLPNRTLRNVSASYNSPAGLYKSSWEMTDSSHVVLSVTVPFGCSATLQLPLAKPETYEDKENPVFACVQDGICYLNAGTYTVRYETIEAMSD
ncbi:MAG: glycoside hydrolase family 78 protein [Clostridiales bacterium]|nr:glycoside hydrolase family 78 protein [Clostridiales bacterium]